MTDANDDLSQKLTEVEEENLQLSERLGGLEADKNQREANDRVALAVRNRKLLPAEVDGDDAPMRKLALSDPDTFEAIIETKPEYDGALLTVTSEEGEEKITKSLNDDDAVDGYWTLHDQLSDEHPAMKSHEVHALIQRDHTDVAKAANL